MLARAISGPGLVTLSGPSGVGKSRLAFELACRADDRPNAAREGAPAVAWVDLASVVHDSLLPEVLAGALEGRVQPGSRPESLVALSSGEGLIVLDGCDEMLDGVRAFVGSLLARCPRARLVATSRQPLGVAGEQVLELGSLSVEVGPPGARRGPLDGDAPRLFEARARAVCPELPVGEEIASDIVRICRHLRGVPLALELFASLVGTHTLHELARALEPGPDASAGSAVGAGPPLDRSVERAMTQAFAMLDPVARHLVEHLAVFAGGADATALASISLAGDAPAGRAETVAGLGALVRGGIVSMRVIGGVGHYDLSTGLRRYVRQRLEREGRFEPLAAGHLSWCLREIAGAEDAFISGPQAPLLERIAVGQDNFRAALRFALSVGDVTAAGRLAQDLWRFWELRGQLGEGRHWLREILAAGPVPTELELHLLDGLGMLAWREGERAAAEAALTAARELAVASGDRLSGARALHHLGLVALFSGELGVARARFDQSEAELLELDLPGEAAQVAASLALVAVQENRFAAAISQLDTALEIEVALGDHHGQAISRLHRSIARYFAGDPGGARNDAKEASLMFLDLGDERSLAFSLLALAATWAEERPALALQLEGLSGAIRSRLGIGLPAGWGAQVGSALAPAYALLGSGAEQHLRAGATAVPEDVLQRAGAPSHGVGSTALEGPWASVKVLGRFEVHRGGRRVVLEPQPACLLKLVVVSAGLVHVEQVMEALWPEVSPERGRRRLRNVLSRLHRAGGPVVVRQGEALVLGQGVLTDLAEFDELCQRALSAFEDEGGGARGRQMALAAADLYRGELLPEDLYEPWATTCREHVRRRWLRLLDAWASSALADGDLLEAEVRLRAGIDIDPIDEKRYLVLAEVLVADGRAAAAAETVARARAVVEELGLPVSDALVRLEAGLFQPS